jgi:hypothetical protein
LQYLLMSPATFASFIGKPHSIMGPENCGVMLYG